MSQLLPHEEIEALRDSAHRASRLLKELANEQRLLILCKLLEGECSVMPLAAHVGLAQSATSQHLARLREEGLVAIKSGLEKGVPVVRARIGDLKPGVPAVLKTSLAVKEAGSA